MTDFALFAALLLISFGLYGFGRNFWLQDKGSKTTGTVLEIKPGFRSGKSVLVSFKTQKDENIKFSVQMDWLLYCSYQVDNKVSVLYDPQKPTFATINSFGVMYLSPIIFTALGLLFLIYASSMSKK